MESKFVMCQNKNISKYCIGDFEITPDDFTFYEKIQVPPPTFCFQCRLQRKLSFINERTLYNRACSKCNTKIVSVYNPQSEYCVFCTACYNSDQNNPYQYGREYDFQTPFFIQFSDMLKQVPRLHLIHKNNNAEGCEYANYTYKSKNVYLSWGVVGSEDIYYSKQVMKGNKSCLDSLNINENERCYELIDSNRNYNSKFLLRSSGCVDSSFLVNCRNCTHCFMSSNQQNKNYMFCDIQLTREEYLRKIEEINLKTFSGQEKAKSDFKKMLESIICRYAVTKNAIDCSGNFIEDSRNLKYCFDTINSENSKYIVFQVNKMSECYDLFYTGKMELCYEVANGGAIDYKVCFSFDIGSSQDVYYSTACNNCHDIFGCSGLTNAEYCILNKQYSKEEYFKLLPKIKQHMLDLPYVDKKSRVYKYGEFFPIELSLFAYNESIGCENFIFSSIEAEKNGYRIISVEQKDYIPTIESQNLIDSIDEVPSSISEEIILCSNKGDSTTQCTYAYKILSEELRLYKLMNIPLPRCCPNCRYYERKNFRLPWQLWKRTCMNQNSPVFNGPCQNTFETSYSPDRKELVYCEDCYKRETL